MRFLVIGCGLVGSELARQLRADGHYVIGTTTTQSKAEAVLRVCSEVRVLQGSETQKVHEAARGCDGIVVCAGPAAQQAMTPEQRRDSYQRILVDTALSAATAPITGPVVALSSLSVYGNAGARLEAVDEASPLTTRDDASPSCFQAAERAYLTKAAGRACVFRLSDVMGGDDLPIEDKIKLAHQYLGGSVPFHDDALFYRVHVLDVVRGIRHALEHKLSGVYNLTHPEVPPSNKQFFDAIADALGVPHLSFRNELEGPTRPVCTRKLQATGFQLRHSPAEQMPAPGQQARSVTAQKPALTAAIDPRGRQLVLELLAHLQERFSLQEVYGERQQAYLPLVAQGGTLDGRSIGACRVFRGGPIHKLVYCALSSDELGLDTHQLYAFTAPDSLLPHFFLDVASSPSTDSTFHLGVDLAPRVDLATNVGYAREVLDPLSATLERARNTPAFASATSVGPLARALRSPWLLAAYVQREAAPAMGSFVQEYLATWLGVVEAGLSSATRAAIIAHQDVAERDHCHRSAMFSPETNRVWGLLERLLGAQTCTRLRDILISADV